MVWHQYPLGLVFIIAGFSHFIKPALFARVLHPYIPYNKAMVLITGVAEITAGIGICLFNSHRIASWAMIGLLIAYIPIHVHMLRNKEASLNIPFPILIIRLAIQFGLIYWAFLYA